MSIAWRTGAGTSVAGGSEVLSETITIPASVQAGDIILMVAEATNASGSSPSLSMGSTGTVPSQIGSTVQFETEPNGWRASAALYWFRASSGDAGATITLTIGASSYPGMSLGAWSGCRATSQPDVSATPTHNTASGTYTAPTANTVTAGDWAVYLIARYGGTAFTGNPGTLRTSATSALADSNGSVGPADTSIGGGTWTVSGSLNGLAGFTVGLAPAASGLLLASFP